MVRKPTFLLMLWSVAFGLISTATAEPAPVKKLQLQAQPSLYYQGTETPYRGRLCLNGMWDSVAIPGSPVIDPFQNRKLFPKETSPFPEIDTREAPPKDGWKPMRIPQQLPRRGPGIWWFRRSFQVPSQWKGQCILLQFMGASYEVVVYVNGLCVGTHRGDSLSFDLDITKACRFGKPNELLVRVWRHRADYGKPWPQDLVESVRGDRQGIWNDVFLLSRPPVAVDNVFLRPSFRKQRLDVDLTLRNDSPNDAHVFAETVVLDLAGRDLLVVGKKALLVPADSKVEWTPRQEWKNPRLWMPDDPHLYLLETRIIANGNRVDVHRERFGFRQTWIENGNFYVNGRIFHFNQLTGPSYHTLDRASLRAKFQRYKACNINLVRTFYRAAPVMLEIADEVGLFIKPQSGWHHPKYPLTEHFKNNAKRTLREWITRDRNHPSVVMWCAANEPSRHIEAVKWVVKQMQSIDPTRPVDVESSYNRSAYDAQGRFLRKPWLAIANLHYPLVPGTSYPWYPIRWAQTKSKPLFFGEWGDFNGPGREGLGADRHYAELAKKTKYSWQGSEMTLEGATAYLEMIIPYWRRLGVSGSNDWISETILEKEYPFPRKGKYPIPASWPVNHRTPVEWNRLDTPGVRFDSVRLNYRACENPGWFPELPTFILPEAYQRYCDVWTPLLAFFPDRTRAVYGGQDFDRSLCLVNDSAVDLDTDVTVTLHVGDTLHASKTLHVQVSQGKSQDMPVRFSLPKVQTRTPGRLDVEMKKAPAQFHAMSLPLEICPPVHRKNVQFSTIVLYDPKGKTKEAFRRNGIPFTETTYPKELPANTSAFVIGRNALDKTILAAKHNILQYIANGGRVLCLHQNEMKPWLPVQLRLNHELKILQSWNIAQGHPLLKGMEPEDFTWWPAGSSNQKHAPFFLCEAPYRKPTTGKIRPLLETGPRLTESPLMEFRHGKGIAYLSQLNLVPLAGVSPSADTLLRRLLTTPTPPILTRKVWYVGDEGGRGFLAGTLGIELRNLTPMTKNTWSENDLIVWMHGNTVPNSSLPPIVNRAVESGATVLYLTPNPKQFPAISASPKFGSASRFADHPYVLQDKRFPPPKGPKGQYIKLALLKRGSDLLYGVGQSELFRTSFNWEGTKKLAEVDVQPKNGWTPLCDPGVIAMRNRGEGREIVVTITPGPDGRMSEKYERLVHTLLVNLGVSCKDRNALAKADGDFFTIDLRRFCTMGFADPKEGDGKGGWTDQGPEQDLASIPTGRQMLEGIPFQIVSPKDNGGKSSVVLGSQKRLRRLPRKVKRIHFGRRKVSRIYFLHAAAWSGSGKIGEYRIRYARATEIVESVPIIAGVNIGDWWNPRDIRNASVAWKGRTKVGHTVGLYLFAWDNPHPDTPIDEIDLISTGRGSILGLVAMTGQEVVTKENE